MKNMANEIELKVLAFFQSRQGFSDWWKTLDNTTQAALEINLIDCIDQVLCTKDSPSSSVESAGAEQCMCTGHRCYENGICETCGKPIGGK